jgi:hypothetical protein
MRKMTLLASAVLGFTPWAVAQVPTSGNVYFGYSFENAGSSALDLDRSPSQLGRVTGR